MELIADHGNRLFHILLADSFVNICGGAEPIILLVLRNGKTFQIQRRIGIQGIRRCLLYIFQKGNFAVRRILLKPLPKCFHIGHLQIRKVTVQPIAVHKGFHLAVDGWFVEMQKHQESIFIPIILDQVNVVLPMLHGLWHAGKLKHIPLLAVGIFIYTAGGVDIFIHSQSSFRMGGLPSNFSVAP